MEIPDRTITCVCLFCGAALQGDENATLSSGDLIKCSGCGEYNDYDSVLEVAQEKGLKQMQEIIENVISNKVQPSESKAQALAE